MSPKFHLSIFSSQLIRWFFDVPEDFVGSFKNIKLFFVRINSNKLTAKLMFYCILIFYFKVRIALWTFHYDHFHLFPLQVYSHKNINQLCNLKYLLCLHVFSLKWIIFASTDCSFVKVTPHCLNPNLILSLC